MDFYTAQTPWLLFFNSRLSFPTINQLENHVHWMETPESHIFSADLPGVRKEEIRVELEDSRYLIIRTDHEANEVAAAAMETPARKFTRKFRLPEGVDVTGISAGFRDGVLSVTVPRAFVGRRFRIDPGDLPERHEHEILAPAA